MKILDLRFIDREGKKILQYSVEYDGKSNVPITDTDLWGSTYWVDVPLVIE